MSATPKLFQPTKVGDITLAHRVVLAPMTRLRNTDAHVPTVLGLEYYRQRASVPGTLLITEAAYIAAQAGGQPNAPGIYNAEQIAAWKTIVDAVHAKGSFIYLQLWALGPSPIPLSEHPDDIPRALTIDEIREYVNWFAQAAKNAVDGAGFDGVEFLQDVSNTRTDVYGGSVENRARFMLQVVDAVTLAVGQKKTALRISPWSEYQDMRMKDPVPTFTYLVQQLAKRWPDLAYLHVVDAGGPGNKGPRTQRHRELTARVQQLSFVRDLWSPRPLVSTGGYDRTGGVKTAEETGQLIGYGRPFVANPDLPAEGYTTYPFSEEFVKAEQAKAAVPATKEKGSAAHTKELKKIVA
ncbi:NADH:flavin oxidoreductase/NADH oxidase [Epithele typhae]|uniref:NADH:flavin oxidoreductase/NADH oxidase n=1 Tax=Epithele typhae TaxID=378194 RepID=UPI002008B1D9|nr:NADH:flavin oxidoreductase/NADH oxidase [Epithele typhae]KAH9940723.1 NADH:flavin oxidoreductase/NADH oxidase [Epithele typhae]